MANVLHSALTGAELHEPKGIASAVNSTVYVANGAGSGTFQRLPPQESTFRYLDTLSMAAGASDTLTASLNAFPFGGMLVGYKCVVQATHDTSPATMGSFAWTSSMKKNGSSTIVTTASTSVTLRGSSSNYYFQSSIGPYDPGDTTPWVGTEAISTLAAGDALELNFTLSRTGGSIGSVNWYVDVTWYVTIIPYSNDDPWADFRY